MTKCISSYCERSAVALGMCKKHWIRNKKGQDINEKSFREKSIEERFFSVVDKQGAHRCWIWKGSKRGSNGMMYGSFWDGTKKVGAHRYSWELVNGSIPDGGDVRGMCICHKCDNPLCVNPEHLFLGTHKDNMGDKVCKGRDVGSKGHCVRGHERNDSNTYVDNRGLKHCRVCHKLAEKKRRAKLRASGG